MRVFLNGCWDCLHPGHINLLLWARKIAGQDGKVIVAVDEDELVMAKKGLQRPIFDHHERAKAILDLRFFDRNIVDEIEFFCTDKMLENIIRRIKPDYILKGSDWRGKKVIGSEFSRVLFMDRLGEYSTTEIIKRILDKHTQLK